MFVEDFAAEASKIDAQIRDLEAAHQDVVRHVSEFVNARNALSRKKAEVNVCHRCKHSSHQRNIEKASEGIPRLVAKITANKDELERLQPIAGDVLVSFKNVSDMSISLTHRTARTRSRTSKPKLQSSRATARSSRLRSKPPRPSSRRLLTRIATLSQRRRRRM